MSNFSNSDRFSCYPPSIHGTLISSHDPSLPFPHIYDLEDATWIGEHNLLTKKATMHMLNHLRLPSPSSDMAFCVLHASAPSNPLHALRFFKWLQPLHNPHFAPLPYLNQRKG